MLTENSCSKEWRIYRESPSSSWEALGPSIAHHGELTRVLPGSSYKPGSHGEWMGFFQAVVTREKRHLDEIPFFSH